MAYLTTNQFANQYDIRRLGQHLSDTGTPIGAGELLDHPVLLQLLDEASDLILSACLVGKKYTIEYLDELAASTNRGGLLRRLTGDICYGLLISRRGQAASDISALAPRYIIAMGVLEQLKLGTMLFPSADDTLAHPNAGLPATADLTLNANYPTNLPSANVRLFGVRPGYGGY